MKTLSKALRKSTKISDKKSTSFMKRQEMALSHSLIHLPLSIILALLVDNKHLKLPSANNNRRPV